MSRANAPPRRTIAALAFFAVCLALAASPLTALSAALLGSSNQPSGPSLEETVEATRQAETRALAAIPALRADETRPELYRARLSDALAGAGDRILSVTTASDAEAGAGLVLRRIDMSFRCSPDHLAGILAAIRTSTPGVRITQVRWDATAITVQMPDPTLRVTAEAYIAAPKAAP